MPGECDVGGGVNDTRWAAHIAYTDERVKSRVLHHYLKLDLIEHIFNQVGEC